MPMGLGMMRTNKGNSSSNQQNSRQQPPASIPPPPPPPLPPIQHIEEEMTMEILEDINQTEIIMDAIAI